MSRLDAPSETSPLPDRSTPLPRDSAAPACTVCGRQDETLRVVEYPYVVSVVILTFRRTFEGLWCGRHRSQRLLLAGLITTAVGFLGIPFGLILAPLALNKLARGGVQPIDSNLRLLKELAAHKLAQGDSQGAIRCLEAALQIEDDREVRTRLSELNPEREAPPFWKGDATVTPLIGLLLGAAAIGLTIGLLDHVAAGAFSALFGEEGSIFVAILSWVPLVALAFVGSLVVRQSVVWSLTQARNRQIALGVGLAVVAASLAVYGIPEGRAIGQYLAAILSGMKFDSAGEAVLATGAALTRGGLSVLWYAIEGWGTAGAVYAAILMACGAHYYTTTVEAALETTRWQQRLSASRGEVTTVGGLGFLRGWLAVGSVVLGLALLTSLFLGQEVGTTGAAVSHMNRAVELMGQGDLEGAVEAFQEAVRLDPGLGEAHTWLGLSYYGLGELELAEGELETAARLTPDAGEARALLAVVYLDRDRPEDAEGHLEAALRLAPRYFMTHYGWGRFHMAQSDYDQAVPCLEEAVAITPEFPPAHYYLAAAYSWRAEFEKAVEALQAWAQLTPDWGAPHALLAYDYYLLDQPNLMERELEVALALGAEDAHTQYYLGGVYSLLREFSTAETHLKRAVELMPDEAGLHLELASVHSAQKEFAEAFQACERALELKPDNAEAYLARASSYIDQEDLDRALEELGQAVALEPESSDVHSTLSFVYLHKDQVAEAVAEAEEAAFLNPHSATAHRNLAFAYHAQEELERATAAAEEAVRLHPKVDTSHYILGLCYLEAGETGRAVVEFETFLDLYWDRAYVREYKAVAEAHLAALR